MTAPLDENRVSCCRHSAQKPGWLLAVDFACGQGNAGLFPDNFEELQNQTGGEIGHSQPLDRLVEVLADIGQQQAERVPIARAGILGQIPFGEAVFDEEAPRRPRISRSVMRSLPFGQTARSAATPAEGVPVSS